MYDFVKTLIDDLLMGPTVAPFTIFGVVLLLGLAALNVLVGADSDDIALEEDDE